MQILKYFSIFLLLLLHVNYVLMSRITDASQRCGWTSTRNTFTPDNRGGCRWEEGGGGGCGGVTLFSLGEPLFAKCRLTHDCVVF